MKRQIIGKKEQGIGLSENTAPMQSLYDVLRLRRHAGKRVREAADKSKKTQFFLLLFFRVGDRIVKRQNAWGISTVGSALHSHCRGQRFESAMLHQRTCKKQVFFSFWGCFLQDAWCKGFILVNLFLYIPQFIPQLRFRTGQNSQESIHFFQFSLLGFHA